VSSLAIGWQYLFGSVAATDPSERERSEWPPHPARVFMALAAAWFETGEDPAEGEALRWLESLSGGRPPRFVGPDRGSEFERSPVTMYVPVNDKAGSVAAPLNRSRHTAGGSRSVKDESGPTATPLQSAPAISRQRQPRTIPRRWIGDEACFLVWDEATGAETHRDALARLCGKVTRIGHSSSLVRMWLANDGALCQGEIEWLPDETEPLAHLRGIGPGLLDHLVLRFNRGPRERHAQILADIERLEHERRQLKGKGSREARAAIDGRIVELEAEAAALDPGPPLRPSIGLWSGYRPASAAPAPSAACSHFDSELLILGCVEGPALPIASSLQIAVALRGAVMRSAPQQPAPAWISGHAADGAPQRGESGHLAIVPLPYVGWPHADGHLMGAALVFPRAVDRDERARLLRALLFEPGTTVPREINLRMGLLGTWALVRCGWDEPRRTLQSATWTAAPVGATLWASATPVVLDRFPKADFATDREAWNAEVAEIVALACERIGLPRPVDVEAGTTPWLAGSLRAVSKRRPLRSDPGPVPPGRTATLGTGFPPLPLRGTNAPRPQVHVHLRFDRPVVGPVLLGAGRFLGYGLLKPVSEART